MATTDGMPEYYDKVTDDTIRLIPAPATANVYAGANIKVQFKRTGKTWAQTDITTGTRTPGFALNHKIMSYMLALPEAMKYKKNRLPLHLI
jgi:hypothetical protein